MALEKRYELYYQTCITRSNYIRLNIYVQIQNTKIFNSQLAMLPYGQKYLIHKEVSLIGAEAKFL